MGCTIMGYSLYYWPLINSYLNIDYRFLPGFGCYLAGLVWVVF